jgi:exonuclease III
LFNWLKKFHGAKSKFVLLQETHTDLNFEGEWHKDWGDKNIIFAHGDSNSKGVAIILPTDIDYKLNSKECDPDGRFIIINVTIDNTNFWIINCYSPTSSQPAEQLVWLNKIQNFIDNFNDQDNDSNIILGGDLNDYFTPKLDKFNPKINLAETDYIKAWKAICNDTSICDIWRILNPNLKRYTWRQGKTKNTLRQSRLDYWLISTHLIYNLNEVDIKPGFRSDHSLINISFYAQEKSNRGPSYWRFNANLLKNSEYPDYINNRINEILEKHKDIKNPSLLWDIVKMELRSSTICFSKNMAAKNRDHIKETIIRNDELEKLMATDPSEDTIHEYNATKLEIEYYNNEKAQGAFVRSRADWAEFGEKNSKYFLNLEKRNYKMKCITKLIKENEEEINNSDEILHYEAEYYKKLYTHPTLTNNTERLQCMPEFLNETTPKISNEDKELCENPIDLEDIGHALKDLKNGKSPGTDGFTPDFYKFFWPKIKLLVLNSLNHAYEQGELSIEQKRGVINLIPKKDKDVRFLKNWRPISLLNTDYKILTKTLAMRLKMVLPNVINEDQVAYLKDRFIGQNIRTIIDIMDYTKNNNITGIIAFLDFEKAFDTIRWDVIEDTLKIFGLGENFIKWTKTIYKNSEACVTNNGFSSPFFKLSRGVRQGCPLSAYLFIMVVELLANKIRQTKDIKGIKIDNTEIKILQMADDTTIFVEDLDSLKCVLKIISLFHMFAGLKLNKTKTEAMWLGKSRNCKEQPLGLKWVNEVHSLGIFFSYDTDYVIQKNFTDKAKKIKRLYTTSKMVHIL